MTTFIIREYQNGVLVPLKYVVQQLPSLVAARWCFRQVEVHMRRPFGLTVQEFEQLTRESPNGFCVPDSDMRKFMDADIQIVDGEIDAIGEDGTRLVSFECFDASEWEIHTAVPALALEMEKRGFTKSVG